MGYVQLSVLPFYASLDRAIRKSDPDSQTIARDFEIWNRHVVVDICDAVVLWTCYY